MPWFTPKTLLKALFFGTGALLIMVFEIHLPISGTRLVTDPREILVTLGAAFTGPIGGIIIGIMSGLIQPVTAFSPVSMFYHALGGFFIGICYRPLYRLTTMPRLLGWWVLLVTFYYFALIIPFSVIGTSFNPELLQQMFGTYTGFTDLYIRVLAPSVIPEWIATIIITIVVMASLPEKFRRPAGYIEKDPLRSSRGTLSARLTAWFFLLSMIPLGVMAALMSHKSTQGVQAIWNERYLLPVAGSLLIVALIAGVVIWVLVERPLRQLTRAAEKMGRGDFNIELKHEYLIDELGTLGGVFNNMTQQLGGLVADLTQQVQELTTAQKALRLSEEKYRNIYENAVLGIFRSTPKGRFIDVNPALAKIHGYASPEEMMMEIKNIGQQLYENPEDLKRYINLLEKQDVVRGFKAHLFRKDKSIAWISMDVRAYRNENDRILYYEGIVQDITEREKAEKDLYNEKQRSLTLSENAPFGMVMIDKIGNYTYINPKYQELFGYSLNEIPDGRTWFRKTLPDPQDRHKVISLWTEDFKDAKTGENITRDFAVTCKDGTEKIINFKSSLLATGEILISCEDITESKLSEERLIEYQQFLGAMLSASPVAVCRVRDRKLVWASDSLSRLTGYSLDELLNVSTRLLYDSDEAYEEEGKTLYEKGWYETWHVVKKDGTKINAFIRLVPMDSRSFIMTFSDITDIKEMQEEKEKLQQQLNHAQKMEAIGTLAGGIAHDFNNILTALIGYGSLLQMRMDKDSPLRRYVEQILSTSKKASGLTQSLLAFSRKQPAKLSPIKLNNIIRGTEKLLERLLTEDIELQIRLAQQDMTIMADVTQIDQILFNLATNARDAMPNGGVLSIETKSIFFTSEFKKIHGYGQPGMYALFSVSDTGIGMDESTKEKIFDPFFTTKEIGKGTGLGLSTVYGIVKQHDGCVDVYSEPGAGTVFRIYFPVIKTMADEAEPVTVCFRKGTETILVAEDNTEVRVLIKDFLQEYGYNIIEAVDGKDAIDKFKEHKGVNHNGIDLIIIDSVMPKKNGREAYDEIRKLSPDIRVLFTSGYTRDIVLDKGIEEKEFDFISKPLSPDELLQKVEEILERPSVIK
ncbi:MAG: PAS domain S-box protein [Proteobacteria bacterium]|nr:PAS domain S-box protein [Pseudomonadota bacterium]